jgi:sec-independent protein translocase protein TatC
MKKYLIEIKNRIFLLLICSLTTTLVSYRYKEVLLFIIVEPCIYHQSHNNYNIYYFIFTNITDLLLVYLKLITFVTLQLIILLLILHVISFLTPALYYKEYEIYYSFIKLNFIFWVVSLILLNYVIVPITWIFFFNLQNIVSNKFMDLHFEAKLDEYIKFYISMYYICVFYCQSFAIFFFLLSLNFSLKIIKKFRKLYYFIFVTLSTLISPPDIFSQILLSASMIITYEFLVISFIFKNILARQIVKTS